MKGFFLAVRVPWCLNNRTARACARRALRRSRYACTLLPEAIEPHRISRTTNVFKSVYFLRPKPDRLCPLDDVRHDRTMLLEERFEQKSCDREPKEPAV